ncbi:chaperone protein DnaJ [compost metagenome]
MKGQGVPYLNDQRRRGDLHVEVYVQVPTSLNEEETELLRRLEEIRTGEKQQSGFLGGIKKALGGKG